MGWGNVNFCKTVDILLNIVYNIFVNYYGGEIMRQVKIIYMTHLPTSDGYLEMENKINETLRDIDVQNGTIKNITYNSVDSIGQVNSAIIEYDI